MRLMPWEPLRETDDLFHRFAMSPLFGRWPAAANGGKGETEWAPAADISETEKEYLVKAEVPGVKPGDIKVTLDGGVLAIEGERRFEKDDKSEKSHRTERFYGSFSRRFALPDDADIGAIRAEGKDGILTVHLPKLAKPALPAARQIRVE